MVLPRLTPSQIERIARIMGDTDGDYMGLKGFEIGHYLADQMINIDLDDRVRVNYAKLQDVLVKIG